MLEHSPPPAVLAPAPRRRDAVETYKRAYAACADLWFSGGTVPTVAGVCGRVQIMNTAVVGRALRDWKEDVGFDGLLARRRAESRQPPAPPGAPAGPDFGQAVAELYRKALAQARTELEAERAALERERAGLREAAARAEAGREAAERECAAHREGARRESALLCERLARAEQALEDARQAAGRAAEEREALAAEAGRRAGEAAGLARAVAVLQDAQREALADLRGQADRAHAWHLARVAEEKEAARAAAQEALGRLSARVRALEPAAARAAGLEGEVRRMAGETARLRRDNARLLRQAGARGAGRRKAAPPGGPETETPGARRRSGTGRARLNRD